MALTEFQIIAQVLSIINMGLSIIMTQSKTQQKFLFWSIIIFSISIIKNWVFLSAFGGAASLLVALTRVIIFYFYKRYQKDIPILILVLLISANIILNIMVWQSLLNILPIISISIGTYGNWQKNIRTTKLCLIIADLLWLIYYYFFKGYMDIFSNLIEISSAGLSLKKENNKAVVNS